MENLWKRNLACRKIALETWNFFVRNNEWIGRLLMDISISKYDSLQIRNNHGIPLKRMEQKKKQCKNLDKIQQAMANIFFSAEPQRHNLFPFFLVSFLTPSHLLSFCCSFADFKQQNRKYIYLKAQKIHQKFNKWKKNVEKREIGALRERQRET